MMFRGWVILLLTLFPLASLKSSESNLSATVNKIYEGAVYLGTGVVLESISIFARVGGECCLFFPKGSRLGNECLLLSYLSGYSAKRAFAQAFKKPHTLNKIPLSHQSWHVNRALLAQIPVFSHDEQQLVRFLEKRWLAKSAGFYPSLVDWVCPCFGLSLQIHPETTNTYARDPVNKCPGNYKKIVESWKPFLPQPHSFPLVLTRPFNLKDYFPAYQQVPEEEGIQKTVEKLASMLREHGKKVVLDLTSIFGEIKDQKQWLNAWNAYRNSFTQACSEQHLDLNTILCIQRVKQEEIGGVRLLPLTTSKKESELQHQFLLEWVSKFGLSANRIELDRGSLSPPIPRKINNVPHLELLSKEEFIAHLRSFEEKWITNHPQKDLMVKATLQVLKGLFNAVSEDNWQQIMDCPTRSHVAQLSFSNIREQFKILEQENEKVLFFDTVSHIEQIHANLSALLEITLPFTVNDFAASYKDLLVSIPSKLKSRITCGIHSSGMTNLAGILKAVERGTGRPPQILYGENTYFESIHVLSMVSKAISIDEATEKDWEESELILAQFNPVLKRIDVSVKEYRAEKVSEILHQSLNARKGRPVTLAIDCTLDFIDSPRVGKLVTEFQEEIEKGFLNIICYRSGLKFDLFGMDNYCGAPFFMINNQGSPWHSFNALVNDKVLQTDLLSLNWFCLAYQSAASELNLYQKQIFDNTRSLLKMAPSRLLKSDSMPYRIVPIEEEADAAFIDIKVSGPNHQFRGSALIGGAISIKSLDSGHPLFYRQSLGFYHPNCSILFAKDCTTIRLTLGLDPAQVDLFAECFEMIDSLTAYPKSGEIAALLGLGKNKFKRESSFFKSPTLAHNFLNH